jgi:hypothetical protein
MFKDSGGGMWFYVKGQGFKMQIEMRVCSVFTTHQRYESTGWGCRGEGEDCEDDVDYTSASGDIGGIISDDSNVFKVGR